jgi:hypothetical protein
MNQAGGNSGEKIKDKIPDVTQAILHVVAKDVEKPHVSKNVEEPSVKKHRGYERKDLLEGCKVRGECRVGVPGRDHAIEENGLLQSRPLGQLPEKDKAVQDDDHDIDQGKMLGTEGVPDGDHKLNIIVIPFSYNRMIVTPGTWFSCTPTVMAAEMVTPVTQPFRADQSGLK